MTIIQLTVNALTLGAIYALVAVGLVLVFKASDLINFGQGSFVMAGAYIGLTLMLAGLPMWAVLLISPVLGGLMGYLLDLVIFRRLYTGSAWIFVVATLGVGGLLHQSANVIFQANLYPFPPVLGTEPMQILGIYFTYQNLWVPAAAVAVVTGLYLFFEHSKVGKAMQAVAQNRTGAQIVGINLRAILSLTWAMSAAVSTIAGLLVAPQVGISPEMGLLVIKGFVAAAIGGFDSLAGALLGGLLVALIEGLTNTYLSSAYKDVIVFGLLLLVMWIRPTGFLGSARIKRV
jgi:branched-chain amino acid transport system permease protein